MAEFQVTSQDIDSLSQKLDELGEVLSDGERAILLGIFGMASNAISQAVAQSEQESGGTPIAARVLNAERMSVTAGKSLPSLSKGFKDAFIPGRAGGFTVTGPGGEVENSVDVSVGGATVSVGWSKDLKEVSPGDIVSQPGLAGGLARPGLGSNPGGLAGGGLAGGGLAGGGIFKR